jgi:hypothetical protein
MKRTVGLLTLEVTCVNSLERFDLPMLIVLLLEDLAYSYSSIYRTVR